MDKTEFEGILQALCNQLTKEAREKAFVESKDFENRVRQVLEPLIKPFNLKVDYDPHAQAFPDIAVGEYGIEVKHAKGDTWRSVANSIQESRREENVKFVYVVFGKMGGNPEVRWATYEDSVMHVRTSHMPRFEVEIGARNPLFRTFGLTYDEFRSYDIHKKMELVRKYARGRLKPGERMWWLEESEESEHSLPIQARLYTKLEDDEKRRLRAEAALLCPQIVKGSRQRDKYDDAVLFILTYHGVLCHQARDLFTAGSVSPEAFSAQCGDNHICRSLMDIQKELVEASQRLDDKLFIEYWGKSVPPEQRISEWLKRLDSYAKGWRPSAVLTKLQEES